MPIAPRSGPLAVLDLLCTQTQMFGAQVIIITARIATIAHQSMRNLGDEDDDILILFTTTKERCILTPVCDC